MDKTRPLERKVVFAVTIQISVQKLKSQILFKVEIKIDDKQKKKRWRKRVLLILPSNINRYFIYI